MKSMKKRDKEIKEIDFFPVTPKKGLICFVSFIYQDLKISDCAILTRPNGEMRLSFPIKTLKNGKTIQTVYPITKELGIFISTTIIKAYLKFIEDKVKN